MIRRKSETKSGQAIIFLVVIVVILAFVMVWNFDLHKTIFVKVLGRDAGDAAALAAARWQGKSLNMIGELNVIQAAILSEGLANGETEFPEVEALSELRTRLNFVGPMVALVAAEQTAKHNGVFNNRYFAEELYRHANEVRTEYPTRYDPPYETGVPGNSAWDDYADILTAVADEGMPVKTTNPYWYADYESSAHYLLNPDFYDAIASGNWCWFYFNAMGLLRNYTNWTYWPELPSMETREPVNSEILSLKLNQIETLGNLPVLNPDERNNRLEEWVELTSERAGEDIATNVVRIAASWHVYSPRAWSSWREFLPTDFPFESPIKEEYNVVGADVALELNVDADRLSPGRNRDVVQWTTAAKPFGTLPGPVPINTYGLVIPGFTDVRLIPVDASTAGNSGSRPGWGIHIYEHLPEYMELGPSGLDPSCWYCSQLLQWEVYDFRRDGLNWIKNNSQTCHQPPPGGGGGGSGGTRRGH